ncbi:MAG: hypothetical protein ACFB12_11675 [Leptolyngbyaceae cyanobacterium]
MRGRLSGGRLLVNRLMVMQNGQVVEAGLTDQVLDVLRSIPTLNSWSVRR